MRQNGLLFILLVFNMLFANKVVVGQDTIMVDMVRKSHEVPLKIPDGSMIFSSSLPIDTSIHNFAIDSSILVVQSYVVDLKNLIYLPEFDADSFGEFKAVVFRKVNDPQLFFTVEVNGNQNSFYDEFIPIQPGKPFRYEVPLFSPDIDTTNFSVPFQFEYLSRGTLSATSLLNYDIHVDLGDTSFSIELQLGVYFPNFPFPTLSEDNSKMVAQNYLMDEPFFFENSYWKLIGFSLKNNTATLINMGPEDRPMGYKKGYYVNFDSLFKAHEKPTEVINRSDSSLFLLYFWGKWCLPCLRTMPSTNALGKAAKKSDRLSMYGVALLNSKEEPSDIFDFAKEKGIVFPNLIERLDGNSSSIYNQLKIKAFPTYVLINSEGQILLTSGSVDNVTQVLNGVPFHIGN